MIIIQVRQLPIHHVLLPIAQAERLVVKIILQPTLLLQARTSQHNAIIVQAREEDIATIMAIQDTTLVAHVQQIHNDQEAIRLNNASALMDPPLLLQPNPAIALSWPRVQIRVQERLPELAIGLRVPQQIGPLQVQVIGVADDPQIVQQPRLTVRKSAA
jgi:hypothetical protein